jgi:glutathione S-transferase
MLTLYYAPGTCALATHLALEIAGADYQTVKLDFSQQQQRSAEYLEINPKGRVPALVTPQGVLTETPALLQYVAQTHPQARLAPLDDPFALAKVNEFNTYLCATVHVNHAHRGRGYRWTDDAAAQEALKKKVPQNMGECFDYIETQLLRGPWVFGDALTTSDLYLFTIAQWLQGDGVDVNRFAKVKALVQRLNEMPPVKKVMAAN